jgi:hypothetical protein
MDSVLNLLKEEINETMEAEHDLAKWKLAVTAALGAAAFGLENNGSPNYWLLLLVPFVCAYVDLYAYQYEMRIRVIARFLRKHSEGDGLLRKYEQECEELRGHGVFSLGNRAALGCSIGASLFGPLFYFLQLWQRKTPDNLLIPPEWAGIIWLVGLALIVLLSKHFHNKAKQLSGNADSSQTAARA